MLGLASGMLSPGHSPRLTPNLRERGFSYRVAELAIFSAPGSQLSHHPAPFPLATGTWGQHPLLSSHGECRKRVQGIGGTPMPPNLRNGNCQPLLLGLWVHQVGVYKVPGTAQPWLQVSDRCFCSGRGWSKAPGMHPHLQFSQIRRQWPRLERPPPELRLRLRALHGPALDPLLDARAPFLRLGRWGWRLRGGQGGFRPGW